MKTIQTVLALLLCFAVLGCAALPVCAEEAPAETTGSVLTGLRWFPVPENRQNDEAWEAECVADGCLCQRFTETAEDTGNTNFLDTEYTDKGGLKLTRNDSTIMMDGQDYTERFWPRVRTISLETSPEFDMKTANTVYYDVEVQEGTEWNISMAINGMVFSLGKFMAAAGGSDIDPMVKEITDAPAGHFKGSVNVNEILDKLAADPNQYDSVNAQALKNMKKTFVPQLQIYCVGGIGSSLTVHELYMSTPEDKTGEKCTFVDMGLLSGLGEEYYEVVQDDEPETDPSAEDETDPTEEDDATDPTTTTKKQDKTDKNSTSALPIILIVAAVVVVVAVVVIIVIKKKK